MTVNKIETFKAWLFDRTKLKELKPEGYLNSYARKQIRKQQLINKKNEQN